MLKIAEICPNYTMCVLFLYYVIILSKILLFDDERLINHVLTLFLNNFDKINPHSYNEVFLNLESNSLKNNDIAYEDILEYNENRNYIYM